MKGTQEVLRKQVIQFVVMVVVGIILNPMNVLAHRMEDVYFSMTLFYGGVLMASNMMWAHEIVHFLDMGHFNGKLFMIGVILSAFTSMFLLREQLFVSESQWLRRMISHHSTAVTTSKKIASLSKNEEVQKLAKEIVYTQEKEIFQMKGML